MGGLSEKEWRALRLRELSAPRVLVRTAAYPAPRSRIGGAPSARTPVIAPASAGAPAVGAALAPVSGSVITLGTTTNAGATTVLVTSRIPFPFLIRHIQLQTDQAAAISAATRVKVASDNSTSGGVDTPGQDVEVYGGTSQLFSNFGKILDCYPNFRVTAANQFVKVVYSNLGAGPVQWQYVIDIDHLG